MTLQLGQVVPPQLTAGPGVPPPLLVLPPLPAGAMQLLLVFV